MSMNSFRLATAAALGLMAISMSPTAHAQDRPLENEVATEPISITHIVNGVSIEMPMNVYVSTLAVPDGLQIRARIYADLSDWQSKSARIVSNVPVPQDNCRSFSSNNLVVKLSNPSLGVESTNQLMLKVRANGQVWQCIENVLPTTKIVWKVKRVGFIKTKVPVKMTVRKASPIKNRLLDENSIVSVPFNVRPFEDRLIIQSGEVSVAPAGLTGGMAQTALLAVGINLSRVAEVALNENFPPINLRVLVPEEFAPFNPRITSVRVVVDGKAKLEILGEGFLETARIPQALSASLKDAAPKPASSGKSQASTDRACDRDAQCEPAEICLCPTTSPTGNCDRPGTCVPRTDIPGAFSGDKAESASSAVIAAYCPYLRDLSGIPPGWHPVSVMWRPAQSEGDQVCIARTTGKQIRFTNWLDHPMPAGYTVIRSDSSLNETFRGCRSFTVLNGQYQCSVSWTAYDMLKNSTSQDK